MKLCLVVDDSKVVRMVARRILEELKFKVTEADNGRNALDRVAETMPDVILLDWNMPVMDGLEFLVALREQHGDGPVVVFCTTENDIGQVRKALEAGANEYIMKPFDIDIVESKLAQVGVL